MNGITKISSQIKICNSNIYPRWIIDHEYREVLEYIFKITPRVIDTIEYLDEKNNESDKRYRQYMLKLNGKRNLIYGLIQSGKTAFMQNTGIVGILLNRVSGVVVLQNSLEQSTQLHNRCKNYGESFTKEMGTVLPKNQRFPVLLVGGKYNDIKKQKLEDAISGRVPSLIVVLANTCQLGRLRDATRNCPGCKPIYMIDEADSIHYGGNYGGNKGNTGNKETEFRSILNELLESAGRTMLVSGTHINTLFSDKEITSKDIIVLNPKENYTGLEHIHIISIENPFTSINGKNPASKDAKAINILREYSNKDFMRFPKTDTRHSSSHPFCVLLKNSHTKKSHLDQGKIIASDPELEMYASIVLNSDGLYLSHKKLHLRPIVCGKTGTDVEDYKNCKLYSKVCISQAMQHVEDLSIHLKSLGKKGIDHIVIISGEMADRGISFVSVSGKTHLTHMIYVPSNTASLADMMQATGRLCGNYTDKFTPVLFAPEKTCAIISKSRLFQQDLIDGVKKSTSEKSVKKMMKKLQISKVKVPNCRLGNKKCKIEKKNKISGNDGLTPVSTYMAELVKIEKCSFLPETELKEDKEVKKEENNNIDSSNKLRLIVPDMIGCNTILNTIYKMSIDIIIETVGTGDWIKRSQITKELLRKNKFVVKNAPQIEGHLRSLYQSKYTFENITINSKGLLMKKIGDTLWMRLN